MLGINHMAVDEIVHFSLIYCIHDVSATIIIHRLSHYYIFLLSNQTAIQYFNNYYILWFSPMT